MVFHAVPYNSHHPFPSHTALPVMPPHCRNSSMSGCSNSQFPRYFAVRAMYEGHMTSSLSACDGPACPKESPPKGSPGVDLFVVETQTMCELLNGDLSFSKEPQGPFFQKPPGGTSAGLLEHNDATSHRQFVSPPLPLPPVGKFWFGSGCHDARSCQNTPKKPKFISWGEGGGAGCVDGIQNVTLG